MGIRGVSMKRDSCFSALQPLIWSFVVRPAVAGTGIDVLREAESEATCRNEICI